MRSVVIPADIYLLILAASFKILQYPSILYFQTIPTSLYQAQFLF